MSGVFNCQFSSIISFGFYFLNSTISAIKFTTCLWFFEEMGFQSLPSWNGARHLPMPKGPFLVGTADVKTKSNLLMRCFYPTQIKSNSDVEIKNESDYWPLWLPEPGTFFNDDTFSVILCQMLFFRICRWLLEIQIFHNP